MVKTRRVKVSYHVTLTAIEFKKLVALGREWGMDHDKAKPLKIAKRALQSCGDSGCLSMLDSVGK